MVDKTRWNSATSKFEESPSEVEAFLDAIEAVCKAHGKSITHEDGHGSFLIEDFREDYMDWLREASMKLKKNS